MGIGASCTTDKNACGALAGNVKDACTEEAKAKSKVALSELESGYTAKAGDRTKVFKAESTCAVAK